ncbi:MAG: hypothetical protein JST58_04705 [Bacteroidetes bacterium]|nr:hypothetical protein [Bacteroidota bacterium]
MLSDQYIEILHQYCECKGVKYYDVQTELVDHLADAIIKSQKEHPELSFREQIAKVDAQFAPDEFALITKNKSKAIRKKYFSTFKEELYSYTRLPKILFLFFLYALLLSLHAYSQYFYFILQLLPLYLTISFIARKKRLKISYGLYLFDSKKPLLSLKSIKWVYEKIIIVTYIPIILLSLYLRFKGFDKTSNFFFFTALFPILMVAFISAVNIMYRIRFQIEKDYTKAFS